MFPMQKRAREDDEDETCNNGGDHKKPRTLPFRTSPMVKHTRLFSQNSHYLPRSHLASNTSPPESSEDGHGQPSYSTVPTSPPNDPQDDSDMDMADAQASVSPCPWEGLDVTTVIPPRPVTINLSLKTPPRESHEAAHGVRVATPRWGHFRSIDMSMELCEVAEDNLSDSSITSQLEWNHRALFRRRRLPSPIGEDTSMMSSPAMTGVPLESFKWVNTQGRNATIIEQTGRHKDPALKDKSRVPTPGKTMLSMGYRADCEKCRTRVPGHYNHVIRT